MKSIFKISGMTCNGCKSSVEDKLSSLDGVDDVQVDLNKGEAVIQSKKPISFSLISNSLPPFMWFKLVIVCCNHLALTGSVNNVPAKEKPKVVDAALNISAYSFLPLLKNFLTQFVSVLISSSLIKSL